MVCRLVLYVACSFWLNGYSMVESAKLRSWLGPDKFLEGILGKLPTARKAHGFATSDDGRIFTFGGINQSGMLSPVHNFDRDKPLS
jgi:hypothetical protein